VIRTSRGARLVALVVGCLVAAGGVVAIVTRPAARPAGGGATANLWIDRDGGSCTRQATPAAYSDAAACASFDAANDQCAGGDTVLVAAGSYGAQAVTGANGRSRPCTIQAAGGGAVTFTTLTTDADWLTLRDMASHVGETRHMGTGGCVWCDQQGGSHLVLDHVDLFGKWADAEIRGGRVHPTATDVTWKNSELGTPGNTADRLCGQDDEPFRISQASDVTIDHDTFHPFRGETVQAHCGGADVYHLETFRLWDTNDGITFSRNRFDDGNGDDSFTIFAGRGGCATCAETRNVTIVNNVFGAKCCGYAGPDVGYGDGQSCTGQGWVFAYNLFKDSAAGVGNNCAGETDTVYVGNIANDAAGGCPVRGTNTANLFVAPSPGTCAGNRWLPDRSRIGLRRDGFHLTAGSPAINAGETTLCARYTGGIDIDGQPRSGVCDAGPDEYVP
jgi:hypothetical protein